MMHNHLPALGIHAKIGREAEREKGERPAA
jgi:hypothetical protein